MLSTTIVGAAGPQLFFDLVALKKRVWVSALSGRAQIGGNTSPGLGLEHP